MKTRQIVLISGAFVLVLLSTINSQLSTCFAQGSLTPSGAPAPNMRTLFQIEPRTPIFSAPFTITRPGSYYLTANLTVTNGDGIDINTNGVTLDLNGFTITSTAATAAGYGIAINSGVNGLRNITIANGFIQGGVTNNGSGVYSGGGFAYGIYYSSVAPVNTLVSRILVSGCLDFGIILGTADSTVVESCTVRTVGYTGISASTIKSCSAIDCGGNAIVGDQVSDCRGQSSGSGTGVYSTTAQNCYGASVNGDGLDATTALNCYGATANNGYGINTTTALDCFGAAGAGYGLYASGSASCCVGYSYSGIGLIAFIADACNGQTVSGTALGVTHNVNSY
jgi:hypothetical protein